MNDEIKTILANGENSFVEFKRPSVSPQSMAEEIVAFANGAGGSIYIGVEDDGSVTGIDIERKGVLEEKVMNICRSSINPPLIPIYETFRIDDQWIARVTISEGIEKPYQTIKGRYLIRVGTTRRTTSREELSRLFQGARIIHIDDYPISGLGLPNLDMNKTKEYFRNTYEIDFDELRDAEIERLLENACILGMVQGKLSVTIAGLIFFQKKDGPVSPFERYFPQGAIQFVAYEDDDQTAILDRLDVYRACPEAVDDVVQKIRINWKTPSRIVGLKREEIPFPTEIFRELVVNAVIHRDYSLNSPTQVRMFPDRIEVVTPGRLVNTVTVERMKAGISVLRNPLLVKFMQNFRYADQLGRGIPMILRRIEKMKGWSLDLIAEEHRLISVVRKMEA
jgi:ATP-dependent DNA helicase RecG